MDPAHALFEMAVTHDEAEFLDGGELEQMGGVWCGYRTPQLGGRVEYRLAVGRYVGFGRLVVASDILTKVVTP